MWHKNPRGLVTVGALLMLAAGVVGTSASLTVLKLREGPAREAGEKAERERDQARKAEAEAKKQCDQALAARQAMTEERDQALAAEKEARRSQKVAHAVLAFLQNNVLSAGHSMGWGNEGQSKDTTLRQALDAAAAKVAKECVDRPLVEASLREILGSTYLELGQAAQAVKQYERALALREAILGADHPDTGDCRNQLAVAYRRADRPDDASRLYDQSNPNDKEPEIPRGQKPARSQAPHRQDARTPAATP